MNYSKYIENLNRNVEECKSSLYMTEDRIARIGNDFISEMRSRGKVEIEEIFPAIRRDIASIRRWLKAVFFVYVGAVVILILNMIWGIPRLLK